MKNPANQSLDLVTLFAAMSTWDGKSPYGVPSSRLSLCSLKCMLDSLAHSNS